MGRSFLPDDSLFLSIVVDTGQVQMPTGWEHWGYVALDSQPLRIREL